MLSIEGRRLLLKKEINFPDLEVKKNIF